MSKGILYLFISLVLFTNTACAEEAKPPVSPVSDRNNDGNSATNSNDDEVEHFELMALKYAGIDGDGESCNIYVSAIEKEHESEDGEHHLEYIVKYDYVYHGQSPADSILDFHRYSLPNKTYYSIDSEEPTAAPALAAATLKDKDTEVNLNKLDEYEQTGELIQSVRLSFNNVNFEALEKALEETLEDNSKFESNKAVLDQLNVTQTRLDHNGHHDKPPCFNFSLEKMEKVEFELGGSHDHDGDHDHDHDH